MPGSLGGGACAVTDEEAIEGVKLLAETEGLFAEVAGGVVIAGLKRLVASGVIRRNQLTVAFITGAGLKTQEAVAGVLHPLAIQPTLESFQEVLSKSV